MTDWKDPVAVIGAGAWGTTLARMLGKRGIDVRLWAVTEELATDILSARENRAFLPGFALPERLSVSADAAEVLDGASALIWVVPSQWLREVARKLAPHANPDTLQICATKGIEHETGMRMSQLIAEEIGGAGLQTQFVALSGPNLSREIAEGQPALSVAASASEERAYQAQRLLSSPLFRVYRNPDIIGVELCGALKNVIAIAAGMSDGLGFGANVRAALMTRGLAEMRRLGLALGAHRDTFAGIAGMGDLITTCTSTLSRNYSTGARLARGESCEEIQGSMRAVAEGIPTVRAELELAAEHGVEVPIAQAVHEVLFEGASPRDAAERLMTRAQRAEF
ncbi:MAG: NAD(P)-dependent glycerol-3-phosphate dehydrogenase [candidate division WS1 bacterium]|jgi:glycerol-3-phosphate dehydrogenase (NAD(P)+)|nr:NAD(P)-dependent glycerol-3-phosphate dehydrogenase [candidate division WS1 bacterium]